MNLPGINWVHKSANTKIEQYFFNYCNSNNLNQLVEFNTRGINILDLILTTHIMYLSDIYPINPLEYNNHISDHLSICANLITNIECNYIPPNPPHKLNFYKVDYISLKHDLSITNWNTILLPSLNCNNLLDKFTTNLLRICEIHTPKSTIFKFRYPIHLKKLLNKCRRLHGKINDEHSRKIWRQIQDKFNDELKTYNLNNELDCLYSGNKRDFYNHINRQLKFRKNMSPLKCPNNNVILTSDIDKANCLSNQFYSVFNISDSKSYIPFPQQTKKTFSTFPIYPEIVRKILTQLPNKVNSSPDGIPKSILKVCSFELCTPLSIIFNRFLDDGICPDNWKKSDVIPLFKKGCPTNPGNYRPISILPTLLIVFEKILSYYMSFHLRSNNLITDVQYGFLSGRSTEFQLLEFYNIITKSINHNVCADIIYLDMAKAFDKVPHNKLLYKLSNYGICGNVMCWFESYLDSRLQRVKVNNIFSPFLSISSGVPQGSVLGPLLFLIYINDLPSIFNIEINAYLFADDAKLSLSYRSPNERHIMQLALDIFSKWTKDWDLELAEHKCCVMSMGNQSFSTPQYTLNGKLLSDKSEFKDLGLTFESSFKFTLHIENICSKARYLCNTIFRCFSSNNYLAILSAYISYIRPILEYNSSIWNPGSNYIGNSIKLEKVQSYFTRTAFISKSMLSFRKKI